MKFSYTGFVIREEAIVELSGIYESKNEDTARRELTACGIRITDLRGYSMADIKIERLKKLRDRFLRGHQ
jgi:hypothetical protein